ncbi:MAG: exo-alpha-sialidase [Planctomycetaceae bacterium]|nr:exo-alpha-sialidase [Planctomycetaceae bacterium]
MKIEGRGLIYDANDRPVNERVAAFVSLCRLSSGALICGFQLGPKKHAVNSTIRFCRSDDDGNTWQESSVRFDSCIAGVPGSLSSGELVELAPGHLLLYATWFDRSDPDRPLFDPETEGILRSKQLIAESHDNGETWSEWRVLPWSDLKGCSSTGPILQWSDGRIALAFESYKEFDDPSPASHGAWIILSSDEGKTFGPPVSVAQHPEHRVYYWDQRLCRGSGKDDAIALFWTHDLKAQKDLPVHFRHFSLSDQPGAPQTITDTGIPGQIAAPCLLVDGRLLAFVVDRSGPMTMKLWQSYDGGKSWHVEDALLVYEHDERAALTQKTTDVDYAEYWEDMTKWSFGHPAIRPLGNSRVLVAFYAGMPNCLSVHWARIDMTPQG